jgi:hypothetical protein
MEHADDSDNDDVFVYTGGLVPQHLRGTITHVRVHKSVKIITRTAFERWKRLVSIEIHDGVEIIENHAFYLCRSLKGIKLPGVRVIEQYAFYKCTALVDVEFGDKLETIGPAAFARIDSLRNIKLPKIRTIGVNAFLRCEQLTDVELSEDLEKIRVGAFINCTNLRRIAIPLKDNLLANDYVFDECYNLSQVDLSGGIHKIVSSLLLDSWKNEMNDEIKRINQVLPNTPTGICFTGPAPHAKTAVIRRWLERVTERIDHFKGEHNKLLKEFTTLLELALWKVKLDEMVNVEDNIEINAAKSMVNDDNSARRELRVLSCANIVIKNVLPFLALE